VRETTQRSAPGASGRNAGSVSVVAARAAIDGLAARRVDAEPALSAARLSREALASIENRLPYESVMRLWEAAAVAADDPAFGVHVAEELPLGSYDVLDYMVAVAATAGDAIGRIADYFRLIHDRSEVRLIVEPRHARLVRRGPVQAPQYDEFSMALFLQRSRAATGTSWAPVSVAFQHARGGDMRELRRVFRGPITFAATQTEMRFAPSVLRLRHVSADSRLLDILTRYADSLLGGLSSGGDLVASVSSAIARQLATGMPSLASTAAAVDVPERTLQRRLASAGVTHSKLVDDIRRGLALKYLGHAGLSILDIAYLLHFSDATSFYRAFKRWTGEAPGRYRTRLFEGAA
jgi:AraC-like DNA-binding protein